eukprot:5912909-Alexandrium_andersonii.AAC.1
MKGPVADTELSAGSRPPLGVKLLHAHVDVQLSQEGHHLQDCLRVHGLVVGVQLLGEVQAEEDEAPGLPALGLEPGAFGGLLEHF